MPKTSSTPERAPVPGLSPWALAITEEMKGRGPRVLYATEHGGIPLQVRAGYDSLWLHLRWPGGGGVLIRAAHTLTGELCIDQPREADGAIEVSARASMGVFNIRIMVQNPDAPLIRWTVQLTPEEDLLLPFYPCDLYPVDENGDPTATQGVVHAGQRGTATGLLYLSLTKPRSGSLLYVQNLTSLNEYLSVTGTEPDTRVGGQWPDLGYTPPVSNATPLPKGKPIVISDACVRMTTDLPKGMPEIARLFLDLLADIYPCLEPTPTEFHDWPALAAQSHKDLQIEPTCTMVELGERFLRPYVNAEYPDSMTQLTVLMSLLEYLDWSGEPREFADALRRGVPLFYDDRLGVVRRYLRDVGNDKDRNAVDSWYLYHPLANVARLALRGDEEARDILFGSLDYAIRAAHHFRYKWPVMFDLETMEVITDNRKPGDPGQSDVGGLYACVMVQAYELSGDRRYLDEACEAINVLHEFNFAVGYQFNTVAWGALACMRLYRETGVKPYLETALSLLASFFHNTIMWESDLEGAKSLPTFLGVMALHDSMYMASYECYESYAAFHHLLENYGHLLPPSAAMLVAEFCRHTLHRAWFTYPGELPEEALAKQCRNGYIDRNLAIPLEDLYPGGNSNGSVGQEIYGAGAAFVMTTRAFRKIEGVPFVVFSEYPLRTVQMQEDRALCLDLWGSPRYENRLRLIPPEGEALPSTCVYLQADGGEQKLPARAVGDGHREYRVPGASSVIIRWGNE